VYNRRSDALGKASYGTVTGTVAYDLWVIGDALTVAFRPRIEAGPAFASGAPVDEAKATEKVDLQLAGLAELAFGAPVGYGFQIETAVHAGAARGIVVRAEDREIASTHGWMLGATLGVVHGL
jgi:hypothetical protein